MSLQERLPQMSFRRRSRSRARVTCILVARIACINEPALLCYKATCLRVVCIPG